jgi:hypothetical protein
MSTEATGDGGPAAADAVGPDEDVKTAEPTATAVAEPTAAVPNQPTAVEAAGRGEDAEASAAAEATGTAWATGATGATGAAWATDGAAADGPIAGVPAGWAAESEEPGEPAEDPEPAESDVDEADDVDEYESDEDYGDYADDDLPEGEALEYDEDYEAYEPEEIEEEPRRARRWPRVLLAFGFVILGLAIVGGAVAIVGSVTHGFKKPVKVTYKKAAVFSLKTGDCLDPAGQSYTLISCDSPHDAEVFGTFALSAAKWPGDTAIQTAASDGCGSRLGQYLNPQLAISLSSTYVYPDSVAWQAGTRTVICEVHATSGQLTGSVRGATATAS